MFFLPILCYVFYCFGSYDCLNSSLFMLFVTPILLQLLLSHFLPVWSVGGHIWTHCENKPRKSVHAIDRLSEELMMTRVWPFS